MPSKIPLILILIMAIFLNELSSTTISNGVESFKELDEAEQKLASALSAIKKAENMGVDSNQLVVSLNKALDLINQARETYVLGDFTHAIGKAEQSVFISYNVELVASGLTESAYQLNTQNFVFDLSYTILGIALAISLLFAVWKIFKKRYFLKVLNYKPEVILNES